ncbi:hypothetical protein BpHYR1_049539 [Brachionus plicatilis]|uniref:Uncharacterized protein n=1 Tax=Brachionus plicatilis TaxID=10195 RepID=A0A3M7SAR4_BRAPC|nr:hypothetical protein BpHYR1_049539 [Brachionus plicatilis]
MKLDESQKIIFSKKNISKQTNNPALIETIRSVGNQFGTINSVVKLNKMIICLLLFVMSVRTLEARFIGYKNFENFCRNFPLHMACMGAFAGGGKRSFDMDAIPVDDIQSVHQGKKSLIERVLSDIQSYKKKKDLKKNYSNFFNAKPLEYDYESNLMYPISDEYEDELSIKQKVLLLKLLDRLSEKYEKEKK